jgi:very-short-patch-repair endonuclease
MTRPENLLWSMLREQQVGLRFRRQHPMGIYILDFYCPAAKLCVEVDGPVHADAAQMEHDLRRDTWLAGQGLRVIRVSSADVEERPAEIIAKIRAAAQSR